MALTDNDFLSYKRKMALSSQAPLKPGDGFTEAGNALRSAPQATSPKSEDGNFVAAARQTAPFMTEEEKAKVARYLSSRLFNNDRTLGGANLPPSASNFLSMRLKALG